MSILKNWLHQLPDDLLHSGRELGMRLENGESPEIVMQEFRLSPAMNLVGTPYMDSCKSELKVFNLLDRCMLLEILGYIDPNLAFASPGPGLAAFVVNELGNDRQRQSFFNRFSNRLHWTFFALTEPHAGSDPQQCKTAAESTDYGYQISGKKMLIGNGKFADVGVVFARTQPGVMGINAFLVEKPLTKGLLCQEHRTFGCKASRLTTMTFEKVQIPRSYLLGQHIKPTERWAKSATAAFTALRPCIAGISIGIARATVDYAKALCPNVEFQDIEVDLVAQRNLLHRVCKDYDKGIRNHVRSGFLKTLACDTADRAVLGVIRRCSRSGRPPDQFILKAYRDIKAFEYTEGMTHVHYNTFSYGREAKVENRSPSLGES